MIKPKFNIGQIAVTTNSYEAGKLVRIVSHHIFNVAGGGQAVNYGVLFLESRLQTYRKEPELGRYVEPL